MVVRREKICCHLCRSVIYYRRDVSNYSGNFRQEACSGFNLFGRVLVHRVSMYARMETKSNVCSEKKNYLNYSGIGIVVVV